MVDLGWICGNGNYFLYCVLFWGFECSGVGCVCVYLCFFFFFRHLCTHEGNALCRYHTFNTGSFSLLLGSALFPHAPRVAKESPGAETPTSISDSAQAQVANVLAGGYAPMLPHAQAAMGPGARCTANTIARPSN